MLLEYLSENLTSSPTAQFLCGSISEKIYGKVEQSLPYYMRAAHLGCAAAQFNIGCFYNNGVAVEKNKKEAAKWFQLGADQGRANAQNNLGVLYLLGDGVPQDKKKAAELFKAASAQGHVAAKQNYVLAIRPEKLKLPTSGVSLPENPIESPRENDEPWDPDSQSDDVPLIRGGKSNSRKRRWSFSNRFFGEK